MLHAAALVVAPANLTVGLAVCRTDSLLCQLLRPTKTTKNLAIVLQAQHVAPPNTVCIHALQ